MTQEAVGGGENDTLPAGGNLRVEYNFVTGFLFKSCSEV